MRDEEKLVNTHKNEWKLTNSEIKNAYKLVDKYNKEIEYTEQQVKHSKLKISADDNIKSAETKNVIENNKLNSISKSFDDDDIAVIIGIENYRSVNKSEYAHYDAIKFSLLRRICG